jgi:hypothetical protein
MTFTHCETCNADHATPTDEYTWEGTPLELDARFHEAAARLAENEVGTSAFDICYATGTRGERVAQMLFGEDIEEARIEVKVSSKAYANSQNIVVERECYSRVSKRFEPSGLDVSKANIFTFVIFDADDSVRCVVSVPTDRLRTLCAGKPLITMNSGKSNPTKGNLLRLSEILGAV